MINTTFRNCPESNPPRKWFVLLGLAFFLIHIPLLIHDIQSPKAFQKADRGYVRMGKIRYMLYGYIPPKAKRLLDFDSIPDSSFQRAIQLGEAGDYLVHALLYKAGGRGLVIAVQLVLTCLSIFALFLLALELGLNTEWAVTTAALYMLLIGNLLQPHILATEGLFNPLLVMGITTLVICINRSLPYRYWLIATALLGVTVFIRTQMLLLPLVFACILWWYMKGHPRRPATLLLWLAVLPLLLWDGIAMMASDRMQLTPKGADITMHLQTRLERMHVILGIPKQKVDDEDTVTVPKFMHAVYEHPMAFAKTVLIDNANYLLNPGITYLLRHIEVFKFESKSGYRYFARLRDTGGIVGVFLGLFDRGLLYALSFLVTATAWLAVLVLAVRGVWLWVTTDSLRVENRPAIRAMLFSVVIYVFCIIQLAGISRWSLRQPAEFVIVLLATFGAANLLPRLWPTRQDRALTGELAARH